MPGYRIAQNWTQLAPPLGRLPAFVRFLPTCVWDSYGFKALGRRESSAWYCVGTTGRDRATAWCSGGSPLGTRAAACGVTWQAISGKAGTQPGGWQASQEILFGTVWIQLPAKRQYACASRSGQPQGPPQTCIGGCRSQAGCKEGTIGDRRVFRVLVLDPGLGQVPRAANAEWRVEKTAQQTGTPHKRSAQRKRFLLAGARFLLAGAHSRTVRLSR